MNAPHRRKEWQEFKDWCGQRKLKAFPAHAWTVATYCLWLDANRRHRTMQKRLDIIARVHMCACKHAPIHETVVTRTLEAIENRRTEGQVNTNVFTGHELVEPKRLSPDIALEDGPRRMRNQPPLVEKRPN